MSIDDTKDSILEVADKLFSRLSQKLQGKPKVPYTIILLARRNYLRR